MSNSVRPHRWQPTRLPHRWDSPGKSTRVGCHFLLQCMEVKSESEVAQSCPTLSDPMDCSLPGSSIHGIFQARILDWVAIAFSSIKNKTKQTNKKTQLLLGTEMGYKWREHIDRCSIESIWEVQFSSVTQSCPTLCSPMNCSSPGLPVHHQLPELCPLSWWCHPTISSSVIPFSHLQSFPVSGSFQMSQLFASGGQRIGVSASTSVLPMNIQDWFALGWTGWISLQSKGCEIRKRQ